MFWGIQFFCLLSFVEQTLVDFYNLAFKNLLTKNEMCVTKKLIKINL